MLRIENGKQSGIGCGELPCFGIVERGDLDGGQRASLQRRKPRQPLRPRVRCRESNAPVGIGCCRPEQIVDSCHLAGVVDLVDIVDEQGRLAAAREFLEQLLDWQWAVDRMSPREPAAWP